MPGQPETVGTVDALWHYPVKSLQGHTADELVVLGDGVAGDRRLGVVDVAADKVLSAKRAPELLDATVIDGALQLPDGVTIALDDPGIHDILSAWLGRQVQLRHSAGTGPLAYEMTFDPPDDTAEYFAIPTPSDTFHDLAALHLLTTATLAGCRSARPDLTWDVRRFRPNIVIDSDAEPFAEDLWSGHQVHIGEVTLAVTQPTVRCAMPLRAQPPGRNGEPALDRQPEIHDALVELNGQFPNHLGVYADVVTPGTIRVGDTVRVDR